VPFLRRRLDRLRQLLPHAEKQNTACFLEEVIKHIEELQNRVQVLEARQANGPNPAEPHSFDINAEPCEPGIASPIASAAAELSLGHPSGGGQQRKHVDVSGQAQVAHGIKYQAFQRPGTPPSTTQRGESTCSEESGMPLKKRRMDK
jgi:hypothetical protein